MKLTRSQTTETFLTVTVTMSLLPTASFSRSLKITVTYSKDLVTPNFVSKDQFQILCISSAQVSIKNKPVSRIVHYIK